MSQETRSNPAGLPAPLPLHRCSTKDDLFRNVGKACDIVFGEPPQLAQLRTECPACQLAQLRVVCPAGMVAVCGTAPDHVLQLDTFGAGGIPEATYDQEKFGLLVGCLVALRRPELLPAAHSTAVLIISSVIGVGSTHLPRTQLPAMRVPCLLPLLALLSSAAQHTYLMHRCMHPQHCTAPATPAAPAAVQHPYPTLLPGSDGALYSRDAQWLVPGGCFLLGPVAGCGAEPADLPAAGVCRGDLGDQGGWRGGTAGHSRAQRDTADDRRAQSGAAGGRRKQQAQRAHAGRRF